MRSEKNNAESQAIEELRAAGYQVIERDRRTSGRLHRISDIVAWGPSRTGDFGPLVSVEVKSRIRGDSMAGALSQLAASASAFGTEINLVFAEGEWLQADPGLMSLSPIDGPPSCPTNHGTLRDPGVLARLLDAQLWNLAEGFRATTRTPDAAALLEVLRSVSLNSDGLVQGLMPGVLVPPTLFVRAWTAAASGQRDYAAESSTPFDVSEAMATIADVRPGERAFDPFAGFGGSLAALSLSTHGSEAILSGHELNPETQEAANALLSLTGKFSVVAHMDSLASSWGSPNVIVSSPPLGLRLPEPIATPIGRTSDGDVAAIALSAEALKDDGRAVLLTTRGWTFRAGPAERLRRWLTGNVSVTALIGIPPVLRITGVPLLITVIDKSAPGDTLVANLESDWREQLAPGGELAALLTRRS